MFRKIILLVLLAVASASPAAADTLPVGKVGIFSGGFAGMGTISGTTTNPADGSAWVGMGIRVEDKEGQARAGTTTEEDGRYRVQVFPGTYRASVVNSYGAEAVQVVLNAREKVQKADPAPDRISPLGKVVPAGSGKAVPAGFGKGLWRIFDVTDGLAHNDVRSILQDREGYLWFGSGGGGVSRYDGQTFTTFTTQDGLAHNDVWSILQDREGHLWFGTWGGVSRYDGQTFTSFTTQEGLARSLVYAIIQDREGALWFGTAGGGVSRYDGQTFTTFTTQDGLAHNDVSSILQDREGHLWFGTDGGGLSRYDGETLTTFTTKDGLAHNVVGSILQDREGHLWFGTDGGGLSRYDGQTFTTFTTKDGLAHNDVSSILQDREGHLWFGTWGGLSRYDGQTFTTFTAKDGLAHNVVGSILQDREGHLWFGTNRGGVSRYDRQTFTTFTTQDGLAHNVVGSILQDREGHLWFGTDGGGVSQYNGQTFTTFTTKDGLAHNDVMSILQDREGHLWFGTRVGVSRYDGQTFTTFTTEDGLAENRVQSIFQDREGHFWFGTNGGGVSRYDGQTFTTFTTKDGLAHNYMMSILQDREGHLWFGTWGGVSRYDGQTLTTFTTKDGLAHNVVGSILQDREGHLWFGTFGGGLSRYDGQVFQTITRRDGLASNVVSRTSVIQDRDGDVWIGTNNGLTRYRPPAPWPPPVFIKAVVTDRRYEGVTELAIPSTVGLTVFEFRRISFKTRPEAMVYRYRLRGYDADWQVTHDRRVEYQDLPRGKYTFEVVAVDRDLVYSESPASVALTVHLPYERVGLIAGLSIAIVLVVLQTVRVVVRDRRLREEAEAELETAHKMQMGLMPRESPQIEGFDIAGRCISANHVGGDFFQYFDQNGKPALAMADVTGHAMDAAIPVVMFSGILSKQMEFWGRIDAIFEGLNRSMCQALDARTFVCFVMGELDPATRNFRLSNGGCPYPYHFRASSGDVAELQVDAYPLGIRSDTEYEVIERQLQPGDRVVFCSDGIIEADNADGDQFGYERTPELIRKACLEDLSSEATIDRILEEVEGFKGGVPQSDDMTCVVLRVE